MSASWMAGSSTASCVSVRSFAGRTRARGLTRLLQCGAGHTQSHLCVTQSHLYLTFIIGSCSGGMVSANLDDGSNNGPRTEQTCSWQFTAAHGRPAGPSRACGSGCGWPCSPACLDYTGQRRHSQQHSRQPWQSQRTSWRCAGPGACAQRGIPL